MLLKFTNNSFFNRAIGVGFCTNAFDLNRMPGNCNLCFFINCQLINIIIILIGWENNSWGYHGDDGKFYYCSGKGKPYGPLFTTGDTIGCCISFLSNMKFYTKNGIHLGIYYFNTNT